MPDNNKEIIGMKVPYLDFGYVRVIDVFGTEIDIVNAARISYNTSSVAMSERDINLLSYLMRHRHSSPFEMCEIKLELKVPIFIARQIFRHRTASFNELSMRYTHVDCEFYIPSELRKQSEKNKQSSVKTDTDFSDLLNDIRYHCDYSRALYDKLITSGVCREQARMVLTLNVYTKLFFKMDLHNLLRLLEVRIHDSAQFEVRLLGNIILDIIYIWVPNVYKFFNEYILNSKRLSKDILQQSFDITKFKDILDNHYENINLSQLINMLLSYNLIKSKDIDIL